MLVWVRSPRATTSKFLFLDRDGVVNRDRPDYVKSRAEFLFYPDALEALAWLAQRGVNVLLISNQSALNRGYVTWAEFWNIHHHMVRSIREAGGDLLAAFYCPHRPDERCACRKPAPGMIEAACRLYSIAPQMAWMIGDKPTDVLTATRAGCRSLALLRPGSIHGIFDPSGAGAAGSCSDLPEAVMRVAGCYGLNPLDSHL